MRLLTLNIQHTGLTRAPRVLAAVKAEQPDVVVLTEVAPGSGLNLVLDGLAATGLLHAAIGSLGPSDLPYTVAVASRRPMSTPRPPFDGTRYVQAALELEIDEITVAAVYAPLNRSKPRTRDHDLFWDLSFASYAAGLASRRAAVVGDWNTGSRALDIGGGPVPGMAHFDALVAAGWVDAWRSLHPDTREFSWHNARSGNGFRLDHALLSPPLASELASARYVHATRESKASDHSALVIELGTPARLEAA